jgi:hypothetical protein
MVQIWKPKDNFCAFETLSKTVHLNFFALMKKRQSFCYPTVIQIAHLLQNANLLILKDSIKASILNNHQLNLKNYTF